MEHNVIHVASKNAFVIEENGHQAYVLYKIFGDVMDIQHTIVPEELQNSGVGSALVKAALEFSEKSGLKVEPSCPFARAYMARHKEYQHLMA
ncbi:MAG: N-acetyltransferase [Culturomica sp.]|jgi:predicted GNAT family acetyltransferase|nr:N-acetyltransferase [Culturomica sp.]